MTATARAHTPSAQTRNPALPALWTGLVLTLLAAVAPVVDLLATGTIEAHVRTTYPDWPEEWVQSDATAIAVGLGVIGLLGVISWLIVLRATIRGRRWATIVATVVWVLAAIVTATTAAPAGAYEQLAPMGLVLITVLPCLAGLVAVVQLWRHRPAG